MAIINMHDAKTQLSDLVARAEAGEEIVIARRNKPAVRLVRVESAGSRPGFGEEPQAAYDIDGMDEAVRAGREFTIMQGGKAVAKVVPVPAKQPRVPGALKGLVTLPDSFFDPLPEDELDAWDGKYSNDGKW